MRSTTDAMNAESDIDSCYRYVCYIDTASCSTCELYKMGMWDKVVNLTSDIGVKYIIQIRVYE